MKLIYHSQTLRRVHISHSCYKDFDYIYTRELTKQIKPIFSYEFENCFYLRDTIFTIFPPQIRFELCFHPSEVISLITSIKRLLLLFRPEVNPCDTQYLVATDNWFSGYFHWLLDALPRIVSFLELVDDECTLILPTIHKRYSYIDESLQMLGIKYITAPPARALFIKKLSYIEPLAPSGNYNPQSLILLKNRFHKSFNSYPASSSFAAGRNSDCKVIWISRSKSSRRHLINEADAIDAINTVCSLEIIYPEDLSFNEQKILYSSVSLAISIHGAALSNMLFMPSGSSVLEIRPYEDDSNNCFYSLASTLQINYGFVFAKKISDSLSLQLSDLKIDDFLALKLEVIRLLSIR